MNMQTFSASLFAMACIGYFSAVVVKHHKRRLLRLQRGESPPWHGAGMAASSGHGVRRRKPIDHTFHSKLEAGE